MSYFQTSIFGFRRRAARGSALLSILTLIVSVLALSRADAAPTRSTTIALTSDEQRLVVVNREANSVSIIRVKNANGKDVNNKIDEIPVGESRAAWLSTRATGRPMSPTPSAARFGC
jgi:hypothetical protein